MKCKRFYGHEMNAVDAFNKWAKGKALTKDVIIHTHSYGYGVRNEESWLEIIVFHPEDEYWEGTETK